MTERRRRKGGQTDNTKYFQKEKMNERNTKKTKFDK